MAATARAAPPEPPHVPVLLGALLEAVAPVSGLWIDGTLGAGGYARGLLAAGAGQVIGIDRDPEALALAADLSRDWGDRLLPVEGRFSEIERIAGGRGPVAGIVLDLGVSSMQLDRPERGFSFRAEGPLDMRMGADGPTAADLVNHATEAELADLLHHYGEERAARRIARAIVAARPITGTLMLAETVARTLPRPKPGQIHPATRTFQALRIAVNDELGELLRGLAAAERLLPAGGKLAVVSFHSLEDRIVKRFLAERSGAAGAGSRHAPALAGRPPSFRRIGRDVSPSAAEVAANPRARSARLRVAERTAAAPWPLDPAGLGLPAPALKEWLR